MLIPLGTWLVAKLGTLQLISEKYYSMLRNINKIFIVTLVLKITQQALVQTILIGKTHVLIRLCPANTSLHEIKRFDELQKSHCVEVVSFLLSDTEYQCFRSS